MMSNQTDVLVLVKETFNPNLILTLTWFFGTVKNICINIINLIKFNVLQYFKKCVL